MGWVLDVAPGRVRPNYAIDGAFSTSDAPAFHPAHECPSGPAPTSADFPIFSWMKLDQ